MTPNDIEDMPENYDRERDEEDYWDEDSLNSQLMNCGMTREGFCMLAGTEHCDWDCHIDWSDEDLDGDEDE
jgi:hypothetical protein